MMTQRQKNKMYSANYKRLGKEKESGSDSGEETELFVRTKPQRIEIPTIEIVVEESDTLQSLAIRHNCKIGDLKRLNNIHNDNEIFAKKTIKVPHRPFTMALAGVHRSGTTSPNITDPPTSNLIDVESINSKFESTAKDLSENEVNEIIFNSHIQQVPCERLMGDIPEDNCEEVRLLPQRERKLSEPVVVSAFSCSGADADINWIGLIVCIVIFIVAIPLIYVFYIAEHPDKFHHHWGGVS